MIFQIVSIAGAILILFAFAAQQGGRLTSETKSYQALNLVGGACLFAAALAAKQYGFILLEGAWTFVAAYGLWRVSTRQVRTQ